MNGFDDDDKQMFVIDRFNNSNQNFDTHNSHMIEYLRFSRT